jgi:ABC-type transport system involved in multi-copper enzyme maturation permease subunit
MNANSVKALALDSLYQVLDNSVFRILAVITAVPILLTFVVGFHEHQISLFFGWKSWSYESAMGFLGPATMPRIEDAQGLVVEGVVALILEYGAGSLGVLFCIAATSFFVPRMIEKGAADVLFSKPLTRMVLYLSRYFAGLLFIALLASVMVIGMYLGLLIVSGYNSPGILIGAFTLTYFFGLIYAVSMLIGVVTRSTVAATLLTIIFFFFKGCIHSLWIGKEQSRDVGVVAELQEASGPVGDEDDAALAPRGSSCRSGRPCRW